MCFKIIFSKQNTNVTGSFHWQTAESNETVCARVRVWTVNQFPRGPQEGDNRSHLKPTTVTWPFEFEPMLSVCIEQSPTFQSEFLIDWLIDNEVQCECDTCGVVKAGSELYTLPQSVCVWERAEPENKTAVFISHTAGMLTPSNTVQIKSTCHTAIRQLILSIFTSVFL